MKIKTFVHALLTLFVATCQLAWIGPAQAGETITYFHVDPSGSPIAATDQSGAVLWREAYQPYGGRLRQEDGGTNSQWFDGKNQESTTGLSYFGARSYDPVLGRFMAVDAAGFDPENIQTFNRYAFANNNPYRFVDPDGNSVWTKIAKFVLKGGNVAATFADAMENVHTVMDSNATKLSRVGAGVSLLTELAPISVSDVKDGWRILKAVNSKIKLWGAAERDGAALAREIGVLREAGSGIGNFGLGSGTREEAMRFGRNWVGEGYTVASDGKTLLSADGLRQFRPPTFKPGWGIEQANFERRNVTGGPLLHNGHLDITQ